MDLAPEGFMHLPDCFERYCLWLWNGRYPREEIEVERRLSTLPGERTLAHRECLARVMNETLAEVVRLFAAGDLRAIVRDPKAHEHLTIPPRAWQEAFFPERMLLSAEVREGHGDYFDAAIGRTPFVKSDEVDKILGKQESRRSNLLSRSALREALIGLVMDGVMTSQEAEDFGKAWRLSPLEEHPDPAAYDPWGASAWSLAMAVAWIAWRDIAHVREAWDDYRKECWEWFGFRRRLPLRGGEEWYEIEGEELKPLGPASLTLLGLLEALREERDDSQIMSVKSAREELWRALTSGSVVATGLDRQRAIVQIPSHEWPYLELASDADLADHLIQRSRGLEPAYTELSLPRTVVTRLWPPVAIMDLEDNVESNFLPNPNDPEWTLWQAAIWVGAQGRTVTSQQVSEEDLDDIGAVRLFEMLSRGDLTASGFNRSRVREAIPSGYWELATLDEGLADTRHYVSFLDDALEGYGGQLTPYGEYEPRWFGIRVMRDDLYAALPDFAPSNSANAGKRRTQQQPRKRAAAELALTALYPTGFPIGLTEKERLKAVNDWLEENGHGHVSLSTLNRAAGRELKSRQSRS